MPYSIATTVGPILTIGVLMVVVNLILLVFWIVELVEIARIPNEQFEAAKRSKTAWVIVVILFGWIGGLIWHLGARSDVKRAHIPPPGAGTSIAPMAGE